MAEIKEKNELSRAEAEKRFAQISGLFYEIELDIEGGKKDYQGKCAVHFNFRGDTESGEALKMDFVSQTIRSLKINGVEISDYEKRQFAIDIPVKFLQSGMNVLNFEYVNLFDKTGSGFHKFKDPLDEEEYIYTDFEPFDAHRLFPCFDQPDLKAEYQLSIKGPSRWEYIHNAPVLSEEFLSDDNRKKIQFEKTAKFSTYLFAIVVGPYKKWTDHYRDIPLGIYCRESLAQYMDEKNIFAVTKESFAFMEEYFDYPYPYKKYDQVFVPEFNFGAMENVACVTFTERYIFRHEVTYNERLNRANTISHEMVHMWFGDLVTMKWWNDLWLNESFADYLSYFTMANGELFPDALEHFFTRKEWAYYQDQLPTTHPIAADAENTTDAFSNFDGISYSKGAAVLRQLQYLIGEDVFKKAIQNYFKRFQESNTTLKDFLDMLSQEHDSDLSPWSKMWLESTGVNTLSLVRDQEGIFVRQQPSVENNLLRTHAVEFVTLEKENEELKSLGSEKLLIEGDRTLLSEDLDQNKIYLLNSRDFDYVKVYLGKEEIADIRNLLPKIADSFQRRLIWGSMWQMLRDAQLSPMLFMQIAYELAETERNLSILSSQILLKMQIILTHYLSDAKRAHWMSQLFLHAMNRLRVYDNGKEEQMLWFRILLAGSDGDDDFDVLADLLDAKLSFPDLDIDQDKRWDIIIRMFAYDYAGARDRLNKEQERDKSDLGRKRYYQGLAAENSESAKEELWNRVLDQGDLSTDYLRYGMEGFHWHIQKENLQKYADKFLEDMDDVYAKDDFHLFNAYNRYLFPYWETSEAFLKKIDQKLAADNLAPLVRKELREHRDNLQRKMRILKSN